MSDRAVGFVLLVLSGIFYGQTMFIKKPQFAQFEQMGSDFFPRGILIALALFSLILMVTGKGPLLPGWNAGSVRSLAGRYREVTLSLVLFPVYLLGVVLIGFLWSSIAYLIAMQLMLKPRRGRGLLYVTAGSALFVWGLVALFQGYLHVVLPAGNLFLGG